MWFLGDGIAQPKIVCSFLVSERSTTTGDGNEDDGPDKAPVMVASVFDWTGFYLGLNGGGASSRDIYTITNVAGTAVIPNSEGCHNATGGLAGGQIGYRGRPPTGCSASKPRVIELT
jgi:hypothetical protein